MKKFKDISKKAKILIILAVCVLLGLLVVQMVVNGFVLPAKYQRAMEGYLSYTSPLSAGAYGELLPNV